VVVISDLCAFFSLPPQNVSLPQRDVHLSSGFFSSPFPGRKVGNPKLRGAPPPVLAHLNVPRRPSFRFPSVLRRRVRLMFEHDFAPDIVIFSPPSASEKLFPL